MEVEITPAKHFVQIRIENISKLFCKKKVFASNFFWISN